MIDLHVAKKIRRTALVENALGLETGEHLVEFLFAHFECIVVTVEVPAVGEFQGQGTIDANRGEIVGGSLIERKSENPGKPLRRGHLVASRNDNVVEFNAHAQTTPR